MSCNNENVKCACTDFYQTEAARALMGEVFHPGGLELTRRLGDLTGLGPGDQVIDVACGRGASALHLVEAFGCLVTGIDTGGENVAAAKFAAEKKDLEDKANFIRGDAERIPLKSGGFDALISECSFCTFHDKDSVAEEMARVLKKGGRLGLSDVTVNGKLPDDFSDDYGWIACVGGAKSVDEYVDILKCKGFEGFYTEDHSEALVNMIKNIRLKLMGMEMAKGLGKMGFSVIDLKEAKRLSKIAMDLAEEGKIGYAIIKAQKG